VDVIMEMETRGKTVITATHDLHIVPDIARRVIVFGEDRRILASGTPEKILSDRSLLLAANLVHLHRHAHEDYWHEHEHEHPEVYHFHRHPDDPSDGGAEK
jgi:cobalt/nickel transport system ATP-binding protein